MESSIMSRLDARNAMLTAFEDGYEELFLSIRPHVTALQADEICRGAFKFLIRKYLTNGETVSPTRNCLLHTAHAFAQIQVDRVHNNPKKTNHEGSALSN